VILVVCLVLGLLLRVTSGNPIAGLSQVRLHGETPLIVLLCIQGALPLVRMAGPLAPFAYSVWLATFPLLVWIAWRNRHQPGMLVMGLGLLLNLIVVSSNGGMPVMPVAAVAAGSHGQVNILVGDFVHVLGLSTTRLPWLADALPLPWAPVLRIVPSPGDLMLYVGVVAFIAGARTEGVGTLRST